MFNFPNIPAIGDIFAPAGGPSWQWDGEAWQSLIITPSSHIPGQWEIPTLSGYSTGIFYDGSYTLLNAAGTQELVGNKLYFTPFRVRETQFFNKIGFNIFAPYTATNARVGVYNANLNTPTHSPSDLIYDAGIIDVTTPGIKEVEIVDLMTGRGKEFQPGEYWLAIVLDGECTVSGNVAPQGMFKFGSSMGPGMPVDVLFSQDHIFGELPASAGLLSRGTGVFPNMTLRTQI